jgi:hypothetical protein
VCFTIVFISKPRLAYGQYFSTSEQKTGYLSANTFPETHKLDGFWNEDEDYNFCYQVTDLSCGPASVQMVLGYFGSSLLQNQTIIAEKLNTSIYDVAYTSKFHLPFDDCGIEIKFNGMMPENSEQAIASLKENISLNRPAIVLMNYSLISESGHFRVVTGYNQTGLFVHDPWDNNFWKPDPNYSGPNIYFDNELFAILWDAPKNVTNWAIILCSKEEIPEFSSWVILPLFLAVTLVVVIYRNRLQVK